MARLMKSMLINRDTLALYIPRVLKTIKIEPHNTSISKLQITWVCRITCSRYTKVARSLQLPGSVLKKTCPSVLTRGYSLPKSVKAPPPCHPAHPGSLSQEHNGRAAPESRARVLMTDLSLLGRPFLLLLLGGRILPMNLPTRI